VSLLSKIARAILAAYSASPDVRQGSSAPDWDRITESDGIVTFRLGSWSKYGDFLETEVFQQSTPRKRSYIWRGQRRSDWSLSSSLDRLFAKLGFLTAGPDLLEARSEAHLKTFRHAARGRRGPNPAALDENEWWALSQHFGLATPLLDWTLSPFAAAYFAFEELTSDITSHRVIFALDQTAIEQKNHELDHGKSIERGRPPILELFDSLSEENPRLVSQGGLFTRTPIGVPVEQWVAQQFEGSSKPVLFRIEIPERDRLTCLRALDRMNINHLSLFPDLSGASQYANRKLEFEAEAIADDEKTNLRARP